MKWSLRKSTQLDRMYKRHGLHKVRRMGKTNGDMRKWLYAKMDRRTDKMRHGLKELIPDTLSMRRGRQTVPDCPKYRWC
jgi:hypothetical protein